MLAITHQFDFVGTVDCWLLGGSTVQMSSVSCLERLVLIKLKLLM